MNDLICFSLSFFSFLFELCSPVDRLSENLNENENIETLKKRKRHKETQYYSGRIRSYVCINGTMIFYLERKILNNGRIENNLFSF